MPLRISGLVLALSASFAFLAPVSLESADANGDTRTVSILNVHTSENATVTFKRNGVYDAEGIKQLSWLLRDWRRNEPTSMSPRLFDILWEVHQETGSQEPFNAVSGYRSPDTNAMLRRRSSAVAEHSQHMLGRAMDSFLPDVPVSRMREIAMRLQRGGVGYYPTSGSPFVHIDAGSVRAWPRMTRDQLARLFPDGKTVHIPADGHPFAGYELAKAEILSAGGSVAGYAAYAEAEPQQMGGRHKSLWAALFGGADEDEDSAIASGGRSTLSRAAASRQSTQVASLAPTNSDDTGVRSILLAQAQGQYGAQTTQATTGQANVRGRGASSRSTPASDQAQPVAVASAAPSPGLPSFLRALSGDTSPNATGGAADAGTTVAVRSNGEARTGTTVASRSAPAAQDDDAKTAGATMIAAFAPLPPRRPKTLAEVASLIDIPLPPTRPGNFDAAEPRLALDASAETGATEEAGQLVALDHPLPPVRPQAFAAAPVNAIAAADQMPIGSIPASPALATPNKPDGQPAETASVAAAEPNPAGQVVTLDHPLPPARPVQFALASPTAAAPASSVAAAPRSPDKDGLTALFDGAALVPARRPAIASIKVANAVVQAALPKAAQEAIAQPASTAGRFSASTAQPVTNHFSGKAVQPLRSLGFAPTE
ncbi:Uncharacterized conserved protein YcbK, DUF882 family [Rhizobiales bacterium GAS188]|nr:Uncharacterized conserved protein YcbK, DUF882 family [Rhizobiales bacterium GAS188]